MKMCLMMIAGVLCFTMNASATELVGRPKVTADLARSQALAGALGQAARAGRCDLQTLEVRATNDIEAVYSCGSDRGVTAVTLKGYYNDEAGPLMLRAIEFAYFD